MNHTPFYVLPLLFALPLACASTPPADAPEAPPSPPSPTVTTASNKPSTPAPEDPKKAEAARRLANDRAQLDLDTKAEAARWTPEHHAAAKKLADTTFPSLQAALSAALKSPHRKPSSAGRDRYRHPLETLEFFGLQPTMTVLEWGPGEGWYTELLAPTLAAQGKLMVNTGDPNGPTDLRATYYAERLKRFLDGAPELYGKVERLLVTTPVPKLSRDNTFDAVLVCRALHGMQRDKNIPAFLAEMFRALKPGGMLGIEQHRAKPDADPDESAKKGYLPEAYVIQLAEAAGFQLAAKSEINANPKDTKDYEEGVWTLPPTFQLKDKDRATYAAIGESDRMTLRFVKPKK